MGLDTSHVWNSEHNCFVSEKHRRIAEIIQDYDPRLHLAFVPPANREANEEFPFAVLYEQDGALHVVMLVKEDEVDERLLARLWENDSHKNDPLSALEAMEAAQRAVKLHEEMEAREAVKEFGKTVLNSPLHTFKHNGKKYT